MRQETLEQILKVISLAAQRYSIGDGIDHSYQYGVNRVSQEYKIAYQTIGDACRRRLGLDHVGEFKTMLKACFDGNPTQLRDVLMRKTSRFYHDKINDFFPMLTNVETTSEIKAKKPETFVPYTVQLKKSDSDILKALAQLLSSKPEEILADVAIEAIKDRMKKAVNQF
jgi:hypothetical protein